MQFLIMTVFKNSLWNLKIGSPKLVGANCRSPLMPSTTYCALNTKHTYWRAVYPGCEWLSFTTSVSCSYWPLPWWIHSDGLLHSIGEVRMGVSWGLGTLPSLQVHGAHPLQWQTLLPASVHPFWVSFLYILLNAVMLTTRLQAELLRLPHSQGRILIDHWIYTIVPPASNIPQWFWMLKRLWLLLRTPPSPSLPFQRAKPRISFPANRHSETS